MTYESDKPDTDTDAEIDIGTGDDNLISLEEWERINLPAQNSGNNAQESPRFCRMNEGVIKRLSGENDESLNEESMGVGLAAMIQLGEAIIRTGLDSVMKILKKINARVENCLKRCNLKP